MKFPATTPTPSQPPLSPHHCGPPLSHALMTSCRVTQGHRSPNWSGLKITPTKIQGIIFNLEHFKDMVYGCDAMTSFSDTAGVVEAERMGWKQEGRGRKSSSQYHCHTQWNNAIWQTLQNLILAAISFGILTWVLLLLKLGVLTPWCPRDETFQLLCMTSNCTGRQRVAQSLGFYGWNGW